MIPNNCLRINAVVTITQRFLFKDIEVNSLSEIYADDFFTAENIESFKENSISLPSEVSVNCVEFSQEYPVFIQLSDNFLNLASVWEIFFDKDANLLTIVCADGLVHTLDQDAIKKAFNLNNLRFLPTDLQAHLYPIIAD